MHRKEYKKVSEYEYTFVVNYLSSFIISLKLLPILKESKHSRIINISSEVHRNIESIDFDQIKNEDNNWVSYSRTKLFSIMFSQILDKKTSDSIIVNSVNPGFILDSNLYRNTYSIINKIGILKRYIPIPGINNTRYGASMILYSMYHKSDTLGTYYSDFSIERPSYIAENTDAQNVLWKISEKISDIDTNLYINNFEFNKVQNN